MKRSEKTLLTISLLMILARFLFLQDTLFVLDEPLFQTKIDEAFQQHLFPLTTFRGSSIPLAYGAGALWIYMPMRFFTANPIALAFYHTLLFSLGLLLFFPLLKRSFGISAAIWSFFLLSTSSLLFFSSRHIWDNTLFIPIGALLLYFVDKLDREGKDLPWPTTLRIGIALALLAGLAINIHLMYGPIVLALGLVWIIALFRLNHSLTTKSILILAFAATFIAAISPYLLECYKLLQTEQLVEGSKFKTRWGDGRNIWWLFLRSELFLSFWGAQGDLDFVRKDFQQFIGPIFSWLFHTDILGWFVKLLAWIATFSIGAQVLARKKLSLLALFSFFSFCSALLVFEYLNIPMAPHYFHPIWWVPFFTLAYGLNSLQGHAKRFFQFCIFGTGLLCLCYNAAQMLYIHKNHGARTMTYGTAVSEQIHTLQEVCNRVRAEGKIRASLDITKVMMPLFPYRYLQHHLSECKDLQIEPVQALPSADYSLYYPEDSQTDARLLLRKRLP